MLNQEIKTAIIDKIQTLGLQFTVGNFSIIVGRDDEKKSQINELYNFISTLNCGWSACEHRAFRAVGKHSSGVSGSHAAFQIS